MVSTAGAIGLLLVSIYCLVQAVRDYRRGAYLMAALGVACAVLLWLIPIETRAVKYDLLP
ncbi:MAG: hypothetical protein ACXW27_15320 [Allosphingosinicella sp.]